MALDIYIRGEDDPLYKQGIIDIGDEVSILIEQIEMLLFTENSEVMGEFELGVGNLEQFIWETNFNEFDIQRQIEEQLKRYCPLYSKYKVKAYVYFYESIPFNYVVIDVVIDNRLSIRTILNNKI